MAFREVREEEEVLGNVSEVLSADWVRYIDDLARRKKDSGWPNVLGWGVEKSRTDVEGDEGRILPRVDEKAGREIEVEEEPDTVESEDELDTIMRYGVHPGEALVREVDATMTI